MAKVVIGLSGGVDSSVAAYVLQQQGHEVIGLFMRNWHETVGSLTGECSWEDDLFFAEMVAKKLDIPFHQIDLSKEYRERVVEYMFGEYEKGRTPNPDVLCNSEIKFDAFLEAALRLGGDYVATGHYCQRKEVEVDGKTIYRLIAGEDKNKDQSYFLCQLSQGQLSKALFPIGDIEKPEVRRIAAELGLATAKRKDSQGICFVGKVDLPIFLQQKLKAKKGDIIEIDNRWSGYAHHYDMPNVNSCDEELLEKLAAPIKYSVADGKKVGEHNGAHFYTVGQRKGLGVGGKAEPLFVIATDVDQNIIYVGQGQNHKGLYRKALFISGEEVHWIRCDKSLPEGGECRYNMRIRYRQPLQGGVLRRFEDGLYMLFDTWQRGVTAGQFATWYSDEQELVGSGVINM